MFDYWLVFDDECVYTLITPSFLWQCPTIELNLWVTADSSKPPLCMHAPALDPPAKDLTHDFGALQLLSPFWVTTRELLKTWHMILVLCNLLSNYRLLSYNSRVVTLFDAREKKRKKTYHMRNERVPDLSDVKWENAINVLVVCTYYYTLQSMLPSLSGERRNLWASHHKCCYKLYNWLPCCTSSESLFVFVVSLEIKSVFFFFFLYLYRETLKLFFFAQLSLKILIKSQVSCKGE